MSNGTVLQWPHEGPGESSTLPARKFRVGTYQVDPTGLLIRNGLGSEHVERKVMEVLVCLARRAPATVTREQLFDEAWQGAYVSDGVLNRVISILRKALDDNPRAPEYIATIPRVGYRLVQPVEWEEAPEPDEETPGRERRYRMVWATGLAVLAAVTIWFAASFSSTEDQDVSLRPLTSDPGFETMPTLAPNGRWLAWVGFDAEGEGGIYIAERDGSSAARLFEAAEDGHFPYGPTWSPDGTELAWHDAGPDESCAIVTRTLVSETRDRRFACQSATGLDWSPDGRALLISQGKPGEPALPVIEIDLETGEQTVAVPATEDHQDLRPRYSPSGDRIATARVHVGSTISASVFDRQGELVTEFRPERGTVQSLDWLSPDELLLSLNDGANPSLWRYRLSSGQLSRIADTTGAREPAVAGSLAVFSRQHVRSRTWTVDSADPEAARIRIESTQLDRHPASSPDGEHLAFVSNRSGEMQVWLESVGGEAVQVTNVTADWIGPPRWRHDGAAFLFESHLDNQFVTRVFDVEDRTIATLDFPFDDVRDPVWRPDGEIVVTVKGDDGEWQLWTEGSDGGWRQITREGGLIAGFSPSGDAIYYTKFNRPGLWRQPWPQALTAEATEDMVVPWLAYTQRRNWAVGRDGIVAPRSAGGDNTEVVLVTADGGESVLASLRDTFIRGLSASGADVLYSGFEVLGADIYELDLGTDTGG